MGANRPKLENVLTLELAGHFGPIQDVLELLTIDPLARGQLATDIDQLFVHHRWHEPIGPFIWRHETDTRLRDKALRDLQKLALA